MTIFFSCLLYLVPAIIFGPAAYGLSDHRKITPDARMTLGVVGALLWPITLSVIVIGGFVTILWFALWELPVLGRGFKDLWALIPRRVKVPKATVKVPKATARERKAG